MNTLSGGNVINWGNFVLYTTSGAPVLDYTSSQLTFGNSLVNGYTYANLIYLTSSSQLLATLTYSWMSTPSQADGTTQNSCYCFLPAMVAAGQFMGVVTSTEYTSNTTANSAAPWTVWAP